MVATRTVVSMFASGDLVLFNLHFAPGDVPQARDLCQLTIYTETEPLFLKWSQEKLEENVVKSIGMKLFENLSQQAAVKLAMTMALTSLPGQVAPLYIHLNLDSDKVEGIPWETLYSPNKGFLALDPRWPIGRMADSSAMLPTMNRVFYPPLRVALVLSAAGVDATPEWDAFYAAINGAQIDLQIQVFVCQESLKKAIEGLEDGRVKVEHLSSQSDLLDAIRRFDPQILHFFCHGSNDGGTYLQLANTADWDGLDPEGSIFLAPKDLYQFAKTDVGRNTWLVVLNCCRGGAAVENGEKDTYSFARLLVTNGFPAAIGMREPIASSDAYTFCGAFYLSALAILQETEVMQMRTGADFTEVEWARVLSGPRAHLGTQHAARQPLDVAAVALKEWTLPVIYVRPEPFMLHVRSSNPALSEETGQKLRTRIKTLRASREYLQELPNLTPAILTEIDQQIAALEGQLNI